jgi:DtxR family Mn-dependent transcriptional regulator
MSVAVENFIKMIYLFANRKNKAVKPGEIAKNLGISSAAATDMARNLANKKLIKYVKYQGMELTDAGKLLALGVVRKHRLWETFLHEILKLDLHEIHREAEMLEHQTSDFLADRICEYLGNPSFDPHGDPIPGTNNDYLEKENSLTLNQVTKGEVYQIIRLNGSEKAFFDFCIENDLNLDSVVRVTKQYPELNMIEIEKNNAKILLNFDFSSKIYVKKMK